MELQTIDWLCILAFFVISLVVGLVVSRRAGSSKAEFFLSGRHMPWWLLGVSMVATTFSTDTPNLVTDFVRQDGVAGNWVWWAFLLTGMLTVFIYAKLWKRSGVFTDIEFYELRYSGKPAAFLRAFRALYLGVFFNIVIMASVTLAAIKIAGVMLGWSPTLTVVIAATITVVYSMLGGLRGVVITDFLQFGVAMTGAVFAAIYAVNHSAVGGLSGLLNHPNVTNHLAILPDLKDPNVYIPVFLIPLAVQWWSVWYPGAEPGGGGYLVQRMLAAKNEKHAVGATLFFNVAHYALRPWPWILVALASLVVFPDLDALRTAFPHIKESVLKNDLAYPAMLTFLPTGLLGMVVASLIAAYMSTISTHLNWGSSYIVNDFWQRFINPKASERELVTVGRISTVLLMAAAGLLAPLLENAKAAFDLMLQIGAGTGLLFILRWFWWRINAFSELAAMIASFLVAVFFTLIQPRTNLPALEGWQQLCIGVAITTIVWILTTLLTRPVAREQLYRFYRLTTPGGPGWKTIRDAAQKDNIVLEPAARRWDVPTGILAMLIGCIGVYAALFATGYWIYGQRTLAAVLTAVALVAAIFLVILWPKLNLGASSSERTS